MTRINDNGIDRKMTAAEKTAYDAWAVIATEEATAQASAEAERTAAAASAKAKLSALGLTDEEVAAIVGGV